MTDKIKRLDKFPDSLPVENLRWRCPEDIFTFKDTSEIEDDAGIIGQDRALEAIRVGLEIPHPGYNIYVSGLTGTGRSSTVREILKRLDRRKHVPDDKLYVHNFNHPDRPRLIRLPAGQGKAFRKDMEQLLEDFKRHLPNIFESDGYKSRIEKITEKYRSQERELFQEFEKRVSEAGFTVVRIQMGSFSKPDLMPNLEGKPVPFEELQAQMKDGKVSEADLNKLQTEYVTLRKDLDKILSQGRNIEKALKIEVEKAIRNFGMPCVETLVDEIRKRYNTESVNAFLDEIRDYTLDELGIFIKKDEQQQAMRFPGMTPPADPFRYYEVNLLVDNSHRTKAPVIIETAPNYKNLFGTIEKVVDRSGSWTSDFMNIKPGTVCMADGGYLVINLLEAIHEPWVWQTLKRTLKYGQLEIENPDAPYMFGSTALKPEPIELNIKVVLIGDKHSYLILYNYDEDFKKIFKICADFQDRMTKNTTRIRQYASFVNRITKKEGIPPFTPGGVAALVEQSVRMADRKTKLSARFSDIADLIREAGYWAKSARRKTVERKHIEKAMKQKIYRKGLIEDQMKEYIRENIIMIDTAGKVKGQINGLAVYSFGEYSFGKPSRITATISVGRTGIINIEREADLSGKIHDKGVQILSGFLRERFAQDKPLALSASICFEQSYGGIDGDSASSTELYLLLAALADLPIRQDIAVTGSVNQHGEIQPIGGVNQKIEGFFEVCKTRRLSGTQGVIIPYQNVDDLQLEEDVLDAVKKGKFHIWSVKTIDEGLEILTGVQAGRRRKNGHWEPGTVNALVDKRLEELALGIQRFYAAHDDSKQDPCERPPKGVKPPPPPKQPTRKEDGEDGSD